MKILVLNCGSSSLKYQLINMETDKVMASGKYERIGEKKNRKSAADLKSFSNRQHFFILLEVLPQ